eukprot:g252.t1
MIVLPRNISFLYCFLLIGICLNTFIQAQTQDNLVFFDESAYSFIKVPAISFDSNKAYVWDFWVYIQESTTSHQSLLNFGFANEQNELRVDFDNFHTKTEITTSGDTISSRVADLKWQNRNDDGFDRKIPCLVQAFHLYSVLSTSCDPRLYLKVGDKLRVNSATSGTQYTVASMTHDSISLTNNYQEQNYIGFAYTQSLLTVEVPVSSWVHITLKHNGGTSAKAYVQGVLKAEAEMPALNTRTYTQNYIAAWSGLTTRRGFKGYLDNIRLWEGSVNDNDVRKLMGCGSYITTLVNELHVSPAPTLILSYDFNQNPSERSSVFIGGIEAKYEFGRSNNMKLGTVFPAALILSSNREATPGSLMQLNSFIWGSDGVAVNFEHSKCEPLNSSFYSENVTLQWNTNINYVNEVQRVKLDSPNMEVQSIRTSATRVDDVQVVATTYTDLPAIQKLQVIAKTSNEVQRVSTSASSVIGGAFTLSFKGAIASSIQHDASAQVVKETLEGLSNIDEVTVTRSGPFQFGTYAWDITFTGNDVVGDVPNLVVLLNGLSGQSPSINIQEVTKGNSVSGVFRLRNGQQESADIAYNAPGVVIQNALTSIGLGTTSVSLAGPLKELGGGHIWTITFLSYVGSVPLLSIVSVSLAGVGLQYNVVNERQRNLLSGTFKVTAGGHTTIPLPYNASTTQMKEAIESLPTVTAVTVSRNGPFPGLSYEWRVSFIQQTGDIPIMTVSASGLNGVGAGASVTKAVTGSALRGNLYLYTPPRLIDTNCSIVGDQVRTSIDYVSTGAVQRLDRLYVNTTNTMFIVTGDYTRLVRGH